MLRAARLKSDLRARSITETLRHNHELHYLDESLLGTPSQFTARLRMTSERPSLLLEEIEDHLEDIYCDEDSIELRFVNVETLRMAYREYSTIGQFSLITSHDSCNRDGERSAHLVCEVTVIESEMMIVLDSSHMQWEDVFHSLTVDFGESDADFEVRRHDQLRKRQNPTVTAAASSTDTAETTKISIPLPPSSSPTPDPSEAHGDVGFKYLDTSIIPPQFPGADNVAIRGPSVPDGFTIKCKNCTAKGTINLFQGSFTIAQANGSSNNTENIIEFFQHGYLELRVNGLEAHVELESSIKPSTSLTLYTVPLPEIGLPGFQIPGIAVVGPIFNPSIRVGFQLTAAFDFTYGFDVIVPNNSSIIVDVGNVTNSSVTGFPDTKVSAIPFQSKFDNISLTASTSFAPELLLGISVFEGIGSAGAGVFFDLPTVKATVSQVAHVDAKCDPIVNTSTAGDISDDIFGSLTNIVPEVDFDLGLVAQAELRAGPFSIEKVDQWTAVKTAFTLPTACISFDTGAKTFVAPTASASAAGGGGSRKNAATAGIVNPLMGIVRRCGRFEAVMLVLALVLGFFLAL
ncbi:hypothetical protein MMC29_003048 [Sticta canariensis]|nr:hypothetical protein [Sticta canariensis]